MTQTTDHNYGSSFDELRVFTKTVGLLAILTAVLYLRAIVSGGFILRTGSDTETVQAILFLLILLGTTGLVMSQRWECMGGIIAIIGAVSVAIIVYTTMSENQLMAILLYSSPFMISGCLCILDWWKHRGLNQ